MIQIKNCCILAFDLPEPSPVTREMRTILEHSVAPQVFCLSVVLLYRCIYVCVCVYTYSTCLHIRVCLNTNTRIMRIRHVFGLFSVGWLNRVNVKFFFFKC